MLILFDENPQNVKANSKKRVVVCEATNVKNRS